MHDKSMLAQHEDFGHVLECDCGSIQMRVGPVTLALDEAALRRLHEMVTEAVSRLDGAAEQSMDRAVREDSLMPRSMQSAWKKISRTRH